MGIVDHCTLPSPKNFKGVSNLLPDVFHLQNGCSEVGEPEKSTTYSIESGTKRKQRRIQENRFRFLSTNLSSQLKGDPVQTCASTINMNQHG